MQHELPPPFTSASIIGANSVVYYIIRKPLNLDDGSRDCQAGGAGRVLLRGPGKFSKNILLHYGVLRTGPRKSDGNIKLKLKGRLGLTHAFPDPFAYNGISRKPMFEFS